MTNESKGAVEIIADAQHLGHLGLPAEMASEIGLVAVVDGMLGVDPQEIVTSGQAVLAMALNGLGYTSRPLYISPQFFEATNMHFLLGKPNKLGVPELLPEHINEHKLGRTLDLIADYGPDEFFLNVSVAAFRAMNIKVPHLHLDTTMHQFEGAYVDSEGKPLEARLGEGGGKVCEPSKMIITRGFCKDGRPEAVQVIQELLVSSDGDVPFMMKVHSGNAADVTVMRERMQRIRNELERVGAKDLFPKVMVGDSKLYSKASIEAATKDHTLWVTRVPNGTPELKDVVEQANSQADLWISPKQAGWNTITTNGLFAQEFTINKWGVDQSFVVLRTEASETRATKSVQGDVRREGATIISALKKLSKRRFSSEKDLAAECQLILERAKFHSLDSSCIIKESTHAGRGRPKKDAAGTIMFYLSEFSIAVIQDNISQAIARERCFVLATNATIDDISTDEIINIYMKDQHGVENAFRFLKDPSYFADAFFLKTPRRIAALLCVMTISLLLYALLQRKLRLKLAESGETLKNQKKKDTKSPTLRWVNQCFEDVGVVRITIGAKILFQFQRMTDFVRKVLSTLGENYVRRYSEAYVK